MAKKRKQNNMQKYLLPMFVLAAAMTFSVVFTVVLTPLIVTRFGFEPIIIMLLWVTGVTTSVLAILFYLMIRKEIKL